MKVLLADFNKYAGVMGGREKVFCHMANALSEHGYEVSCLVMDDVDEPPFFYLRPEVKYYNLEHLIFDELTDVRIKHPSFRWPLKIKKEIMRLFNENSAREFKENYIGSKIKNNIKLALSHILPDVIISFVPLTTKYLMMEGETVVPVITMVHDSPDISFSILTKQVKNCLNKCYAVQVCLNYAVDIVKHYCETANVIVIGNVAPQYEKSIEYKEKSFYKIVNVARIDKSQKRQHILIEAFGMIKDKYPNWSIELWGPCTDNRYMSTLKNIIKKFDMGNRVSFCGTTNNVHDVLLNSDLFAFPSSHEAFGLALAEAMSAGLPVIGMDDCLSVKEMVQENHAGLISRNGVDCFSEMLCQLMESMELRKCLGETGRNAMRKYDKKTILEQWVNVIEKASKNRHFIS